MVAVALRPLDVVDAEESELDLWAGCGTGRLTTELSVGVEAADAAAAAEADPPGASSAGGSSDGSGFTRHCDIEKKDGLAQTG